MRDEDIIEEVREILIRLEDCLGEMKPKERDFTEDMILEFEKEEPSITVKQYEWLVNLGDIY